MNTQAALKAEAFEQALARVSRRVGVLARQSAAALRAQRLAMARAARQSRATSGAHGRPDKKAAPARSRPKSHRALRTPATKKARASTQAMGARRQAKRDSNR